MTISLKVLGARQLLYQILEYYKQIYYSNYKEDGDLSV